MNSQLTQIAHSTRIEDFRRDAARLDRPGGVAASRPRMARRLARLFGRRQERTTARAATSAA